MHVNPSKRLHSSVKDLVKVLSGEHWPVDAAGWRTVILAGEIVVIMKPEALCRLPDGQNCMSLVQQRLRELIEAEALPPFEREQGGIVLGKLGDPRPGVVKLPASESDSDFWVELPGGEFKLGETRAQVKVPAFKLSRYPITRPKDYDPVFQTPNHPRVGVCWYDAAAGRGR